MPNSKLRVDMMWIDEVESLPLRHVLSTASRHGSQDTQDRYDPDANDWKRTLTFRSPDSLKVYVSRTLHLSFMLRWTWTQECNLYSLFDYFDCHDFLRGQKALEPYKAWGSCLIRWHRNPWQSCLANTMSFGTSQQLDLHHTTVDSRYGAMEPHETSDRPL